MEATSPGRSGVEEPLSGSAPGWSARVRRAWGRGGMGYVWHKTARKTPGRCLWIKRLLVYHNPRAYWTLRGGEDYFHEQEDQPARTQRSEWLARAIARLGPRSVLEVGCGYGKQLAALRRALGPGVRLAGADYSPSQLSRGRLYLDANGCSDICTVLASGTDLPFADRSFDLVFTSAVILHNPPAAADRIRREVMRVTKRWCAHNEDTDRSYNRYGYDTAAWYRAAGIPVVESGPIADLPPEESAVSQFTVADLTSFPPLRKVSVG